MDVLSDLPLAVRIRLQRIKPDTQRQYLYALGHFAQWLESTGQDQKADADLLDAQLDAFAESVFRSAGGSRRQTVACARLACIWLNPALKQHKLPRSLAVANQTAWYRAAARTVQSHPPITWPLLCVIAHRFAEAGDTAMATAVILAFDALLRVGEVAELELRDISEQHGVDARLGDALIVTIRFAKTADSTRDERQSVTVRDPVVMALVRKFVAERRATARPTDKLFEASMQQLERVFCAAADALNGVTQFTWHSMRHGGATYLYMAGVPVEDISIRGRWRSLEGLRRYLQTGRATVASHGVDPRITAQGEAVAAALRQAAGAAAGAGAGPAQLPA
jgi:integrase